MQTLLNTPEARLARARMSLEGLSVGDAFGGMYFVYCRTGEDYVWGPGGMVEKRLLFAPPWDWTDDTLMACSVYANLRDFGQVNQDALADDFAHRYDPARGYGPSMHGQLQSVRAGMPWAYVAHSQFGGQGTFGNGAAMRVAPLGAYFADDLAQCVEQATLASEVTHTHPEGIAGGVAVAVASALATRLGASGERPTRQEFIEQVLEYVPPGETRQGIPLAQRLDSGASLTFAAATLGTGLKVSSQDTVPFTLWCAGEQLDSYEEALWLTLQGMGDRDTTCAIVGGIVAPCTGAEAIPTPWRDSREPLPAWTWKPEQPKERTA